MLVSSNSLDFSVMSTKAKKIRVAVEHPNENTMLLPGFEPGSQPVFDLPRKGYAVNICILGRARLQERMGPMRFELTISGSLRAMYA